MKELHRIAQDLEVPKAEMSQHEARVRYDLGFVRLAFRSAASGTNERTVIFSLPPQNVGLGHSLFANAAKTYKRGADGALTARPVSALRLLLALAWFNSLAVDWLARQMIQINVSLTYLHQLPMPQPTDAEILSNPDFSQLARNALLLTLASSWDDFAELAPLFNLSQTDLPFTAKAQDLLRAQNDKTVARLYGITDVELAQLLRSFKGLAAKRPEYLSLLP